MSFWEDLRLSLYFSLYLSLLGLPFTIALSVIYAIALKAGKERWVIASTQDQPERIVPLLGLAILGGIGGDFAAVCSLAMGEWWTCRTQHRLCNEGQGGMALLFTIPLLAIVGALIAWGWTWLSLRIPAHHPWASIFCYRGPLRWLNWILALVIPVSFWALVTMGLIRVTL